MARSILLLITVATLASRFVQAEVTFASIIQETEFASAEDNPDYTCSKTRPCKSGCCGQLDDKGDGVCGLGPEFCGESCFSTCQEKSECDPGWGMQWSNASTCPLNVWSVVSFTKPSRKDL